MGLKKNLLNYLLPYFFFILSAVDKNTVAHFTVFLSNILSVTMPLTVEVPSSCQKWQCNYNNSVMCSSELCRWWEVMVRQQCLCHGSASHILFGENFWDWAISDLKRQPLFVFHANGVLKRRMFPCICIPIKMIIFVLAVVVVIIQGLPKSDIRLWSSCVLVNEAFY